jgi:hypothetical protein
VNLTLKKDIKREFLNAKSETIQEQIMMVREGIIKLFLLNGRHHKTEVTSMGSVTGVPGGEFPLRYGTYTAIVETLLKTVDIYGESIDCNCLQITYRANGEGNLEFLNIILLD